MIFLLQPICSLRLSPQYTYEHTRSEMAWLLPLCCHTDIANQLQHSLPLTQGQLRHNVPGHQYQSIKMDPQNESYLPSLFQIPFAFLTFLFFFIGLWLFSFQLQVYHMIDIIQEKMYTVFLQFKKPEIIPPMTPTRNMYIKALSLGSSNLHGIHG